MSDSVPRPPMDSDHAKRFDALLGQMLAVPKAELLRREEEYKKQRAAVRKKKG